MRNSALVRTPCIHELCVIVRKVFYRGNCPALQSKDLFLEKGVNRASNLRIRTDAQLRTIRAAVTQPFTGAVAFYLLGSSILNGLAVIT
jgi:hypothetical protein